MAQDGAPLTSVMNTGACELSGRGQCFPMGAELRRVENKAAGRHSGTENHL